MFVLKYLVENRHAILGNIVLLSTYSKILINWKTYLKKKKKSTKNLKHPCEVKL